MGNPCDRNKRKGAGKARWLVAAALLGLPLCGLVRGQQIHRNGFESREPVWTKGAADARYKETIHEITDLTAHTGQFSEHIQLNAEQGTYIHYVYPIGKAPVSDELHISVFVKANRPWTQLLARVVLPHVKDPDNPQQNLTTLLRGDQYQNVGHWGRLDLRGPVKLAKEQQQLMRAQLQRDVDFADAYIDRLILNVYGGPGLTDVWVDDLEAGPVLESIPFQTTSRPVTSLPGTDSAMTAPPSRPTARPSVVQLTQDHLLVGGKRFFIRGIRHSDTPMKTLRDAGFNAVWLDRGAPTALVDEAVNRGFWLVPALGVTRAESRTNMEGGLTNDMNRFLQGDAVLFWDVGGALVQEQKDRVGQAIQLIRSVDSDRPIGGNIWDGFRPYSRPGSLGLLGVNRFPLGTGLEFLQYKDWLEQRRLLARPQTFMWTWIQTHLPEWYTNLIYERSAPAGFSEPIGPQPEQIRLLTYMALGCGYQGLGFWSDRFLADSHQGHDRLLELALLNQEIQMLEPMLTSPAEAPRWISTSIPDVKAAVLRTEHGTLVLPMWLGKGAQFVPGQEAAAANKLTMVVPDVSIGTQAWEISPVEVRTIKADREVGGMKVAMPEFGLTAAVLFTADTNSGVIVRLQNQVARMRQPAAQWAQQLAQDEMDKVTKVEALLEKAGHPQPDSKQLLEDARNRLGKCVEYYNTRDYRQAYQEADRTLRPLRILMRAQWESAIRGLDGAVASPYAVSFYSLARHWQFLDQISHTRPGANLLPEGDFELAPNQVSRGWVPDEQKLDPVRTLATRVSEAPKEGKQCLKLEIAPENPALAPEALERTFLAIHSPQVSLQPGSLVRISGWVRIPRPITATADGALLYDSAGGEPLAFRLTQPTAWKKFTWYRWVPASGTIHVTMALTGLGTVYFDDVRIEPLLSGAGS